MMRYGMLIATLGLMLGVGTAYAQDDGFGDFADTAAPAASAENATAEDGSSESKAIRFEPMVYVSNLSGVEAGKPDSFFTVLDREGRKFSGSPYKAYPYSSTFELSRGAVIRLQFAPMTYGTVRGPACIKFGHEGNDWRKVSMTLSRGDLKLAVDTKAKEGQFTLITPIGSFTSLAGMFRVHVGDIADGKISDDDFGFRVLSGKAGFSGLHYSMPELNTANQFVSAEGKHGDDSRMTGKVGEMKVRFPSADKAKPVELALSPGAVVKIGREKAPYSDNWVVSVLALYANGEAMNYFCFVDNREGRSFHTGELIAELLPEEKPEEDAEDVADADALDSAPAAVGGAASGDGAFEDFGDFGEF